MALSAWNFPTRLDCLASGALESTCPGLPIYGVMSKLHHVWLELEFSCLSGKHFTYRAISLAPNILFSFLDDNGVSGA